VDINSSVIIQSILDKFYQVPSYSNPKLSDPHYIDSILFYVKGEKVRRHIDDPHAVQLKDLKKIIHNLNEVKKLIGKKTKIKMRSNIK